MKNFWIIIKKDEDDKKSYFSGFDDNSLPIFVDAMRFAKRETIADVAEDYYNECIKHHDNVNLFRCDKLNNVRKLRLEHKLNVSDMADRCGVSKASISAPEIGARELSLEVGLKIAKAFDVPLSWLMKTDESIDDEVASIRKRKTVADLPWHNKVYRLPAIKKREKMKIDTSFMYKKGHSLYRDNV